MMHCSRIMALFKHEAKGGKSLMPTFLMMTEQVRVVLHFIQLLSMAFLSHRQMC